jgi:hypothetical protein
MTPTEYFAEANHVSARIWKGFGADMQAAGLAQATRQIEHYIGTELPSGDTYLWAVYEQAFHVIKSSGAMLDHENNRPDFIPPDADDAAPDAGEPETICLAARSWLEGAGKKVQVRTLFLDRT